MVTPFNGYCSGGAIKFWEQACIECTVSGRKKMFGGEVVASAVQNVLRLINLSPNMVLYMM